MSPEANYPKMPIHIIEDEKNRKKQRQEHNRPQIISPYDYPDRPPEEERRKDDKPQSGVTEWQMKMK
jgi:hypothetical protein